MPSDTTKPGSLATEPDSELQCLAAYGSYLTSQRASVQQKARQAVAEAIDCGARFILTERDFLWEPSPGANRSRIRKIIADAKSGSAAGWHAFRAAIAAAAAP
jgi:hypothetical protein